MKCFFLPSLDFLYEKIDFQVYYLAMMARVHFVLEFMKHYGHFDVRKNIYFQTQVI
jgi:hypothetical protein